MIPRDLSFGNQYLCPVFVVASLYMSQCDIAANIQA